MRHPSCQWSHRLALPAALIATLVATTPAGAAGCNDAQFVDLVAEAAWINIDVAPAQGTGGVREALRLAHSSHANQPVRIRLAPGVYADTLGNEIYAQRLQRTAANPIWLQASDSRPNATVLGHGINLLGVSYIAIDGVTIGPATVGAWNGQAHANPQPLQAAAGIHVAGAALNARSSAIRNGALDTTVYGRYEPSHHILVRRVTVQNLFDPAERDAETSESLSMDGMKFNQVQDLWVLDSAVRQTTRHGIDNVGVHRAAFCRNVVAQTGGGLGIEAKGGSVDVLYDSNSFYRVRRVELGGEETDATYYFSLDGRWDYEALRTVARNNLIVDAREAALEFSGCQDCVAVNNSIVFTAAYQPPSDGGTIYGGDAMRVHDSRVLGAADGAGSDCQFWDAAIQDYVTVDPCWGVGAQAPAPVNKLLRNANLTIVNNLFSAEGGSLGRGSGDVVPCPLNVTGGNAVLTLNANFWWNGGSPLPANGCSALTEGPASRLPGAGATASPINGGAVDAGSLARIGSSIITALLPTAGSALQGMAVAQAQQGTEDRLGAPRGNAVGALLGSSAPSDRLFNFGERFYPQYFAGHSISGTASGYYYRYYPLTQNYIGTANGHLHVLGPAFNNEIVDLGLISTWLPLAMDAGL
ncbi:hypothetical protein [Aquabacterium sp.]|uniref:hypothetical protein n=1 Tax=Aquabacterium sp. TaxID=1872578 RepID=UPI002BE71075|nr:hypothetical protein [Aquabacterium sp.]HSW06341.1 hypothetical protein [Aquabacterium sp.]